MRMKFLVISILLFGFYTIYADGPFSDKPAGCNEADSWKGDHSSSAQYSGSSFSIKSQDYYNGFVFSIAAQVTISSNCAGESNPVFNYISTTMSPGMNGSSNWDGIYYTFQTVCSDPVLTITTHTPSPYAYAHPFMTLYECSSGKCGSGDPDECIPGDSADCSEFSDPASPYFVPDAEEYYSGTSVTCDAACQYDVDSVKNSCEYCGDGTRNGVEDCDGDYGCLSDCKYPESDKIIGVKHFEDETLNSNSGFYQSASFGETDMAERRYSEPLYEAEIGAKKGWVLNLPENMKMIGSPLYYKSESGTDKIYATVYLKKRVDTTADNLCAPDVKCGWSYLMVMSALNGNPVEDNALFTDARIQSYLGRCIASQPILVVDEKHSKIVVASTKDETGEDVPYSKEEVASMLSDSGTKTVELERDPKTPDKPDDVVASKEMILWWKVQ